jgi:hypothetical protein
MVGDMVVRTRNKAVVRYTILVVDNLTDAMNWRMKLQLFCSHKEDQRIAYVCMYR